MTAHRSKDAGARFGLRTLLAGLLAVAVVIGWATPAISAKPEYITRDDVQWSTLGADENDSMPIGNGDLAANVWTEQNGDLVLLIAKSDAWSELGKLDKLARIRIHFSHNPFVGDGFTQTLRPGDASVELRRGANRLIVWADANRSILHVTGTFARATRVEAHLELWRTKVHSWNTPSPDRGGMFGEQGFSEVVPRMPIAFDADTVLPPAAGALSWYHRNTQSLYPLVLKEQHLEQLASRYPDPLLGRIFGATLTGTAMRSQDDHTLVSASPERRLRLDLVALTTTAPDTALTWQRKIAALAKAVTAVPLDRAWREHQAWWDAFWNRSWIRIDGAPDAHAVEQGYALQRYMMAASSRGAYPVKYNGGLFTVGRDMAPNIDSTEALHNPDYRKWGSSYWNQNNRQLYWPLLASGDIDLMRPWFDMYLNALPLARDRTRAYFHHGGAAFIETIDFWGLPTLNDFGRGNPGIELESPWMRYHTQGTLEVVAQMLDAYAITQDPVFLKKELLPFARDALTYYAQHWNGRDKAGKILFYPSQSIETYQVDATDPTPDIAGLYWVIRHLLDLPAGSVSANERREWSDLLHLLPPIPTGTTHDGKIPPHGRGDADGKAIILPALNYGDTKNVENPELYAVFPYRLYGVGKPDLTLARNTFAARLFPLDYCWGQDGEQAALLGLTAEARKAVVKEFTNYGTQRFKWFWTAANDWVPDLDNGGAGMTGLQYMLMQTDGRKIRLLPAWPTDWTADFKLHAPYSTTVEGHVEHGHLTALKVMPASRARDVEVLGAK